MTKAVPLFTARLHKGRTDVIQLLVDHGANLEAHDKEQPRYLLPETMKGMDVDSHWTGRAVWFAWEYNPPSRIRTRRNC